MIRSARFVAAALTLVVALAAPAALGAQEMTAGTWSGSIVGPDGIEYAVDFEVSGEGEDLAIMLLLPEMGESVAFEDISVGDGELSFTFYPGLFVSCTLDWQEEGEYSGECIGEDGNSGILTMVPPEDG